MKLEEKDFMGIPIYSIQNEEYGEMISLNLLVKHLGGDPHEEASKILKEGIFTDSVVFFETSKKDEYHYFISQKDFYGWLYFAFPGHPLLKEFNEIASSALTGHVGVPVKLNQN